MGIRVRCPNGHKLNLKETLAGRRGVCPRCGAKFTIPGPENAAPVVSGDMIVPGEAAPANDVKRPKRVTPPAVPIAAPAPAPPTAPPPVRPAEPPPIATGLPIVAEPARTTVRVRRRRRRGPVQWVVWLTIAVVVLTAVFAWVLLNR